MSARRLFIAGAKCPGCALEDKLQLCTEGDKEWVECVRCGYTDTRPKTVVMKEPDEPDTNGVVRFTP